MRGGQQEACLVADSSETDGDASERFLEGLLLPWLVDAEENL